MLAWQYCLKVLWLIPAMSSFKALSLFSKARLFPSPSRRLSRLTICQELLTFLSPIQGLLLMRHHSSSHSYSGTFATRLYSTRHNLLNHSEPIGTTSDSPSVLLDRYMEELVRLRGTPELVDRLENLASKYPGLEMDINLFRSLYSFKLDQFQEEGLLELISGDMSPYHVHHLPI